MFSKHGLLKLAFNNAMLCKTQNLPYININIFFFFFNLQGYLPDEI